MHSLQAYTDIILSPIQRLVDTKVLCDSGVLILGAGGIGSYATDLLVRMGIGRLTIWDVDKIELRNLVRTVYAFPDWGKAKSKILLNHVKRINPQTKIVAFDGDILKAPKHILLRLARTHQAVLIAADNFRVHEKINSIFYNEVDSVYTYVTNNGDSGEIIRTAPNERGCVRCLTNFKARRRSGVARDFQALCNDFIRVSMEAVSILLGILLRRRKGSELFQTYVNPSAHLFIVFSRRRGALAEALPPGFLSGTVCVETNVSGPRCPVCRKS